MVVGIISDTHLGMADARLKAVLANELGGAEAILHAGDHTSEEVVDFLEFEAGRRYYGVAGNMDPPSLHRRLTDKKVVELGGLKVGLVHGWGAGEGLETRVLRAFESQPDVIVFGHSHVGLVRMAGPTLLVNPGSLNLPRGGKKGTAALLEITDGRAVARIITL